jgi:hypothetical protein
MVDWKKVPPTKKGITDTTKGKQLEELLNNFKLLVEQELAQTQVQLEKAKFVKARVEEANK